VALVRAARIIYLPNIFEKFNFGFVVKAYFFLFFVPSNAKRIRVNLNQIQRVINNNAVVYYTLNVSKTNNITLYVKRGRA